MIDAIRSEDPIRSKIEALGTTLSLPTVRKALGVLEGARRVHAGLRQVPGGGAGDAHEVGALLGLGEDEGHVVRRGVVVVVVKAAGVDEVRARAAKLRRAGVHHVDEGLVVTGNVAGQDVGALVARRQEQAGEEVLYREGLPGAKAGVGAVGGNHVKVGLLDRDLVGSGWRARAPGAPS